MTKLFGLVVAMMVVSGCAKVPVAEDAEDGAQESASGETESKPVSSSSSGKSTTTASGTSSGPRTTDSAPSITSTEGIVSKPEQPRITQVTAFGRVEGFPTYLAHLVGAPTNTLADFEASHLFREVKIQNPSSRAVHVTLRGSLQGYTAGEGVLSFDLKPNEEVVQHLDATLDFSALGKISAPVAAAYSLTLTVGSEVVSSWSKPISVLPRNTVFWAPDSTSTTLNAWSMSLVVGSFTTPHDGLQQVSQLLHTAATYSQFGSMVGYQFQASRTTPEQVYADSKDQLGAIYNALKSMGVNYTDIGTDFFKTGIAQTVRYPAESLLARTSNCIDGSLVFASALEAIGMRPEVVIVPGHAFVAVRTGRKDSMGGDSLWVVETTVVSSKTFEEALTLGGDEYASHSAANDLTLISLEDLRSWGYSPSPFPIAP